MCDGILCHSSGPALLFDLLLAARCSERAQDIEILILRQQVHILQRALKQPPRPSPWENLILTVVAPVVIRPVIGHALMPYAAGGEA